MQNFADDVTEAPQEFPAGPGHAGIASWVEDQVRNTPWWLISIAFHLIVLRLVFLSLLLLPFAVPFVNSIKGAQ